ncbi:hypothetical protein E2562_004699 [Oryza meyeriana var. granulata]|uniref:Uncharacterized protein n=1 Tax=Oryza meyeriana var. granulata TaxID=110450 RepID=A0A6G1DDL7_9ORYZ|nr:hypothetical protein E2562_004699 [Oryza meyeriana var. granulata]
MHQRAECRADVGVGDVAPSLNEWCESREMKRVRRRVVVEDGDEHLPREKEESDLSSACMWLAEEEVERVEPDAMP